MAKIKFCCLKISFFKAFFLSQIATLHQHLCKAEYISHWPMNQMACAPPGSGLSIWQSTLLPYPPGSFLPTLLPLTTVSPIKSYTSASSVSQTSRWLEWYSELFSSCVVSGEIPYLHVFFFFFFQKCCVVRWLVDALGIEMSPYS